MVQFRKKKLIFFFICAPFFFRRFLFSMKFTTLIVVVAICLVVEMKSSTSGSGTSSVNNDCARLGTCLGSPIAATNAALAGANSALSSTGLGGTSLASSSGTSPMSMSINDCANLLIGQLEAVQNVQSLNDEIWSDVSSIQGALTSVEDSVKDLLTTQSDYATELSQVGNIMNDATKRATNLTTWLSGQKVIRSQLTNLFTQLNTRVLKNSNTILVTTSSLRDALNKMQVVHDNATQILQAVGDAETDMYEWAANVTQKVNSHTVDLVGIAQTLQYRRNQLSSVKDANVNLNWIMTQLSQAYPAEQLKSLSQAYDAGQTKSGMSGAMSSLSSTSITDKSKNNLINTKK